MTLENYLIDEVTDLSKQLNEPIEVIYLNLQDYNNLYKSVSEASAYTSFMGMKNISFYYAFGKCKVEYDRHLSPLEFLYTEEKLTKDQILKNIFNNQYTNKLEDIING
jgi:hypothetical protein